MGLLRGGTASGPALHAVSGSALQLGSGTGGRPVFVVPLLATAGWRRSCAAGAVRIINKSTPLPTALQIRFKSLSVTGRVAVKGGGTNPKSHVLGALQVCAGVEMALLVCRSVVGRLRGTAPTPKGQ